MDLKASFGSPMTEEREAEPFSTYVEQQNWTRSCIPNEFKKPPAISGGIVAKQNKTPLTYHELFQSLTLSETKVPAEANAASKSKIPPDRR